MEAAEVAPNRLDPPEAVNKSIHGSRASPRTDFHVSSFKCLAVRPELCRRQRLFFHSFPFCTGGSLSGLFKPLFGKGEGEICDAMTHELCGELQSQEITNLNLSAHKENIKRANPRSHSWHRRQSSPRIRALCRLLGFSSPGKCELEVINLWISHYLMNYCAR
jgi:hypothetical protein